MYQYVETEKQKLKLAAIIKWKVLDQNGKFSKDDQFERDFLPSSSSHTEATVWCLNAVGSNSSYFFLPYLAITSKWGGEQNVSVWGMN